MELVVLTREMLTGSPTKEQREILGVPWPLPHQWLKKMIGRKITQRAYIAYLNAGSNKFKQERGLLPPDPNKDAIIDLPPGYNGIC